MIHRLLLLAILLGISPMAVADTQTIDATTVLGVINESMAPAINKLTSHAITWLGAFATLQFFITNYNLLKTDGDIQSALAKMAGAVAWVGICIYIINNGPQFISAVGDQMFSLLGVSLPSPGSIIASTLIVVASLAGVAITIGGVGLVGSTTAGMLLVYLLLFILAVGMFFAFKIFMLQLELGLVAMLSPLSFSFLGLNTLRDQGIAPFKALLSIVYRVILLTVILSAFDQVSAVVKTNVTAVHDMSITEITASIGEIAKILLSAFGAYLLLAYLVFKSDAIAATLASGSTSMGTGDVAQAAAAGAAVGAAVATGGASAAATAGKVPQSMASFMDKMASSGSISNASPLGSGGSTPSFTPPAPASLSVGGGQGAPSGSPGSSLRAGSPPTRPNAAAGSPPPSITSGRFGGSNAGSPPKASAGGTGSRGGENAAPSGDPMTVQPAGQSLVASAPGDAQPQSHASAAPGAASSSIIDTSGNIAAAKASRDAGQTGMPALASPPAGSPAPAPAPEAPTDAGQPAGSGQTASIARDPVADTLSEIRDHLVNQQAPRKPTLGERLGDANRHLSQEQAAVHVSISPHHHD